MLTSNVISELKNKNRTAKNQNRHEEHTWTHMRHKVDGKFIKYKMRAWIEYLWHNFEIGNVISNVCFPLHAMNDQD